jgi:HSP20 family protein
MSDLFFSTNLLGEFDRLARQMASVFAGFPASLRARRSETSPRPSIDSTGDSVGRAAVSPGPAIAPAVIGCRENLA